MLEMSGIVKRFGANEVLRGVSLRVARGETVVVIGPSGSGKTTLLRCVNLLEDYQEGTVSVDGAPVGYAQDRSGSGSGWPNAKSLPRASISASSSRATTCFRT